MASRAVFALSKVPDIRAMMILSQTVADPRQEVRVSVAASIRNLKPSDANNILLQLLADTDLGVRKFAVKAVSETHDASVHAKLRDLGNQDPSPSIRAIAQDKLRELRLINWKVLNSPLLPFTKVAFANADSGIVISGNGKIVTTTNGGTDWIERTSGTNVTLRDVAVIGLERAWVVGDDGTIIATTDGGVTFIPQNSGTSRMLGGVSFVSSEKGWVVGVGTIIEHRRWRRNLGG
jgi:Flp pilus assembly CpaF family ATPase